MFFAGFIACIMSSIANFKGPRSYVKQLLFGNERKYSILMIISLVVALFTAIFMSSYLLSLLSCIGMVIAFAFFMFSAFPGGADKLKRMIGFR